MAGVFMIAFRATDMTCGPNQETISAAIQCTARGDAFSLVLIKPSHYDDDGYVIRLGGAPMTPSNSLHAAVYGHLQPILRPNGGVLGRTLIIDIEVIDRDEYTHRTSRRPPVPLHCATAISDVFAPCRRSIETNIPAPLDIIARPFRAAWDCCRPIGGFHVSVMSVDVGWPRSVISDGFAGTWVSL